MSQDKLPQLNSRKLLKALSKLGYVLVRRKSSHMHLRGLGLPPLTVPDHDPIAKGTLRAMMRQVGLSKEKFMKLLEK